MPSGKNGAVTGRGREGRERQRACECLRGRACQVGAGSGHAGGRSAGLVLSLTFLLQHVAALPVSDDMECCGSGDDDSHLMMMVAVHWRFAS